MGYEVYFKNVREKFGKPFPDVVREMAKQGHSKRAVAKETGIPFSSHFVCELNRLAPDAEWAPKGFTLQEIDARAREQKVSAKSMEVIRELGRRPKTEHYKTIRGVTGSRTFLANHFGISVRTVTNRIVGGMGLEEALTTPVKGRQNVTTNGC